MLIVGILAGLKIWSKPQKRTEEFGLKAAEGSGALGAGMFALQKLLNPEAVNAKEVQVDFKGGRYNKKKREGKGNGNNFEGEENDRESN